MKKKEHPLPIVLTIEIYPDRYNFKSVPESFSVTDSLRVLGYLDVLKADLAVQVRKTSLSRVEDELGI